MILNDGSMGPQMRPQIQTPPRPMVGAQQPMMRQPTPWGGQAGPIQPRPTREQVQARSFGSMGQPMQQQPINPMMAGMAGPGQNYAGPQGPPMQPQMPPQMGGMNDGSGQPMGGPQQMPGMQRPGGQGGMGQGGMPSWMNPQMMSMIFQMMQRGGYGQPGGQADNSGMGGGMPGPTGGMPMRPPTMGGGMPRQFPGNAG